MVVHLHLLKCSTSFFMVSGCANLFSRLLWWQMEIQYTEVKYKVTLQGPCGRQDGDLHAVGWAEGPWALVTPVKAFRVGVGLKNVTVSLHRSQIRNSKNWNSSEVWISSTFRSCTRSWSSSGPVPGPWTWVWAFNLLLVRMVNPC